MIDKNLTEWLALGLGAVVGNRMAQRMALKGQESGPYLIAGGGYIASGKTKGLVSKALFGASLGAGVVVIGPTVDRFLPGEAGGLLPAGAMVPAGGAIKPVSDTQKDQPKPEAGVIELRKMDDGSYAAVIPGEGDSAGYRVSFRPADMPDPMRPTNPDGSPHRRPQERRRDGRRGEAGGYKELEELSSQLEALAAKVDGEAGAPELYVIDGEAGAYDDDDDDEAGELVSL